VCDRIRRGGYGSEGVKRRESLQVAPEQILRYAQAGPRYTSYPTAPMWTDTVGSTEGIAALKRSRSAQEDPLCLYVHLPFCERRCLFCGCTVEITRQGEKVTRYLDRLDAEFDLQCSALGDRRQVIQMHWGGGTPTHLSSAELERLFSMVERRFDLLPDAELSIEIHPHVTTDAQIATLTGLGFNRFSMGVQDTDPEVQRVIHRDQTLEDTQRCVETCRGHGVGGINFDLMYGLPLQTEQTFSRTLDAVASLRPDRLAIYGYAHVPWLKKAQIVLEREGLPGPVERANLLAQAIDRLGEQDYRVIGLDHFALPTDSLSVALEAGTLERNFMGYAALPDGSRMGDMLSFGASAIADVGGAFLQNERTTASYEAALEEGRLPVARGLVRSLEDNLRRAAISSLMCRMHLDLDELQAELGLQGLQEHFAPEWMRLAPFAAEGLCDVSPRRVDVRPLGRVFLRHLAMVFDAYLDHDSQPNARRFSQTV